MQQSIIELISKEAGFPANTIETVQALFEEGNTIPFLARYRKERTGGLDEVQLASIRERLDHYQELQSRKSTILATIEKAGLLDDKLRSRIENCFDRYELEDLYLPYKPKRRTRAQLAREQGMEPLAIRILDQKDDIGNTLDIAAEFGKTIKLDDPLEVLQGAKDIVAEMICEKPEVRQLVRDLTWREGMIEIRQLTDKSESSGKYEAFDKTREAVRDIPSHRMLAILRGSKEKELAFRINVDPHEVYLLLDDELIRNQKTVWRRILLEIIRDAYERLLGPQIETEIRQTLKQRADSVAIDVFAENLRVLLFAPPLVGKCVLALDPGFRTGAKVTVIDRTGKLIANDTVYPVEPKNDIDGCFAVFDRLHKTHAFDAVAVGNGTAGRETFKVVRHYLKKRGLSEVIAVLVNESGASIYSASEIAREEFPDYDVTVRGSVSIGRRLQDPLAELVKIDPKSIGVGQYQHDVEQKKLARKLDDVVELCVNSVGVDINTASEPLLSRVAGLTKRVAHSIVSHRNENGVFTNRKTLLSVPHLGTKTFEQAAGFLRVVGDEPLDNSSVHPERYELVRKMAEDLNVSIPELIGNKELVLKIDKNRYLSDDIGHFTITDILEELVKPNRDPRDDFSAPEFDDDITDITDLEEGMELEGVATNVAKFGVFVNIGVKQDGMIHVSELDHRYISDPAEILKVGDRVKVKVIELDIERKRIGLSRKQLLPMPKHSGRPPQRNTDQNKRQRNDRQTRPQRSAGNNTQRKPARQTQKPKSDVIASGRMADLLKAALAGDKEDKN